MIRALVQWNSDHLSQARKHGSRVLLSGDRIPDGRLDLQKDPQGKETPGLRTGLVRETMQFIEHKAKAILPYYLAACALTPLVRFMTGRSLGASYFASKGSFPRFLQRRGLGKPFIGCTWYLSSLFYRDVIFVYPLCRKILPRFTRAFSRRFLAQLRWGHHYVLTGSWAT